MPRPKTQAARKNYGISLDMELMKEIQHLAVEDQRRTNEVIEEALRLLLKQKRKDAG